MRGADLNDIQYTSTYICSYIQVFISLCNDSGIHLNIYIDLLCIFHSLSPSAAQNQNLSWTQATTLGEELKERRGGRFRGFTLHQKEIERHTDTDLKVF